MNEMNGVRCGRFVALTNVLCNVTATGGYAIGSDTHYGHHSSSIAKDVNIHRQMNQSHTHTHTMDGVISNDITF